MARLATPNGIAKRTGRANRRAPASRTSATNIHNAIARPTWTRFGRMSTATRGSQSSEQRSSSRSRKAAVRRKPPERRRGDVAHRRHQHVEKRRARRHQPRRGGANLLRHGFPADRKGHGDQKSRKNGNSRSNRALPRNELEHRKQQRKARGIHGNNRIARWRRPISERRKCPLPLGPRNLTRIGLGDDEAALQPQIGLADVPMRIGAAGDARPVQNAGKDDDQNQRSGDRPRRDCGPHAALDRPAHCAGRRSQFGARARQSRWRAADRDRSLVCRC